MQQASQMLFVYISTLTAQSYADLSKVKTYAKKATALYAKLEAAGEKVESFNQEEDAFDWERTQYPARTDAVSTLAPYRKLYDTVVDFDTKYE